MNMFLNGTQKKCKDSSLLDRYKLSVVLQAVSVLTDSLWSWTNEVLKIETRKKFIIKLLQLNQNFIKAKTVKRE